MGTIFRPELNVEDIWQGSTSSSAMASDVLASDLLAGIEGGAAIFDEELRLLACNDAYRGLCGYDEHELSPGRPLPELIRASLARRSAAPEHIEKTVERVMARLQPGVRYSFRLSGVHGQAIEICRNRLANGRLVETVRTVPEGVPQEASDSVERFIDAARSRLRHALESMADGFALYDAEDRLVVHNQKYVEYNPHIADLIMPGASYDSMLRLGIERRGTVLHGRTPEEMFEWRLAQHRSPGEPYDLQLADGRWIRVHERRTEDGGIVGIRSDITEIKRREVELVEAGEQLIGQAKQLDAALNAMSDGLALFDAEDRLVLLNEHYKDLHQEYAEFLKLGMPFEELVRAAVEADALDRQGMAAEEYVGWLLQRHAEPGTPYEIRTKGGRWIHTSERRTPDGGIIATASDITAAKTREAEILRMTTQLRAKNIQFDTALNNMVQGLCMFDAEQRLLVCNDRYLAMYGFSPDVVKPGIRLPDIMRYSVSLGNYTQEDAERALKSRPFQAELRVRSMFKQRLKDGRVIAVMHEPMSEGGSVATYEDITETELREQKLQIYTRKLEISNRELQDFAYVASHDLQEPLRKIEAFGGRLQKRLGSDLPPEAATYIERMQNAAGRMRLLINDLLSYSRVTTKASPFKPVSLRGVLDGVLSDLQIRIEETEAEIAAGELPTIDADALQMRQLLQNLIGNALKFQKPGMKPIVKIAAEIFLDDPDDPEGPQSCRITVADNGIGFDNKYQEQIFTVFQRLHGRGDYEGTGIGLATCRKIVERHGGTVAADGRPGEGATFTITLPVNQPEAEATS